MPRNRRILVIVLASLVVLTVVGTAGWVSASAVSAGRVTVISGMPPICDDPVSHAAKPVRDHGVAWPTLMVDSRLHCRVAVVVRNDSPAPITVESIRWPMLGGPPLSGNGVRATSRDPLHWKLSMDPDDSSAVLVSSTGGEELPRGGATIVWTWMVPELSGCLWRDMTMSFGDVPDVTVSVLGRRHTVSAAGPTIAFRGTAEAERGCEGGTGGLTSQ